MTNNFIPGVGRLATDRYDFESHINGSDFKHDADIITLDPPLTIPSVGPGVSCTNVQQALTQALPYLAPVTLPDASVVSKGVIQLSGDVSGTATNIIITGLQQRPINVVAPNTNDVLTWNGTTWGPLSVPVQFLADGDLTGSSLSQQVIAITGVANLVNVKCNNISFASTTTPNIVQASTASSPAAVLSIKAQNSTTGIGGALKLSAGFGITGQGALSLQLAAGSNTLLQISEPVVGNSVLSLVKGSDTTVTQMPAGTGNRVIYIADASTAPTVSPVGGTILYSNAGKLCIKQSNGTGFIIGANNFTSPVSIDDNSNNPVYFYKYTIHSAINTRSSVFTYSNQNGPSTVLAEINMTAVVDSNDGYVYSSTTLATFKSIEVAGEYLFYLVGTETVVHSQSSGSWTSTPFYTLTQQIAFRTGAHATQAAEWTVFIKLQDITYG